MNFLIYLNGEECGALTAAEYVELRRATRADWRTWAACAMAQVVAAWRFMGLIFRMFGVLGGIGVVGAMYCAPSLLEALNGYSASEIANALRQGAVVLTTLGIAAAGGVLAWAPDSLRAPDVFEDRFFRRLRSLKGIRRTGKLELMGVATTQTERGQ